MSSFLIREDQENRAAPQLRQKQTTNAVMAANTKRPVLATIDHNIQKKNLPKTKTKQVKETVKNERNNCLQLPPPTIPVAQFEAFNVYEDVDECGKNDKKPEEKKVEIKKDKENLTPMSVDKSLSHPLRLAEDVILQNARAIKDEFFELEEYRDDIYRYLRQNELRHRPKPGYITKQPDVTENMRAILVDWLVEVSEEYKLHTETLYLAVNFIDRFLSYMSVVRAKLQLVGTAAMFLAAKYEEIFPPDISEFVYITDDTYNKHQVIRMEHLILKVLSFDLTVPTPLCFINAICISGRMNDKTLYLAMFLGEISMLEVESYLSYLPSQLAAAAIIVSRHTFSDICWNAQLEKITGYELKQLEDCVRFIQKCHKKSFIHPQRAIPEKYKKGKYLHVSEIKPRNEPIEFV